MGSDVWSHTATIHAVAVAVTVDVAEYVTVILVGCAVSWYGGLVELGRRSAETKEPREKHGIVAYLVQERGNGIDGRNRVKRRGRSCFPTCGLYIYHEDPER